MVNNNSHFLGNIPLIENQIIERIIKPITLTESSFAYDIFEFKFDKQLGRYELKGLYHQGIREIIKTLGFYKRYLSNDKNNSILVHQVDNILDEVTDEVIKTAVLNYVDGTKEELKFSYRGNDYNIPIEAIKNIFLKQSCIFFNQKWLQQLSEHTTPILRDLKDKSFVVFKNCLVEITKNGIKTKPLNQLLNRCVWREQQIQRDFEYLENGNESEYAKFCKNVTSGIENRTACLLSIIGYLIHNHFDPSKGQAIILYDEAITDSKTPQGGTGKGLIANSLKWVRMTTKIDGKMFDPTSRFKFELVCPSTQLIWFDETNKDFVFVMLFSQLTDGWTIERKYLPQFTIKPEDSPKMIICSNSILSNEGSSNKRRQHILELNNYYSSQIIIGTETPIQDEHGLLFAENWTQKEWNLFYSFMFDCTQFYFENGLVSYESKNVATNYLKQKTNDDFVNWVLEQNYEQNVRYFSNEIFKDFQTTYFGESFQKRTFINWIKFYSASRNWTVDFSKSNGNPYYIFK
jgi:hypothetical protein